MPELPRCRRTTWAEAERWADLLAGQILGRGPAPEVLVALTRGGWVPARLLADRLGVHQLLPLRVRHWGVTATPSAQAELIDTVGGTVSGQSVLIVDDLTDTGQSLRLAREHVERLGPARLATATFLHMAHSQFVPEFFAEEIPREAWVWVVFPWNYWEDLRELSGRVRTEGADAEAVRAMLAARCGLEVPLQDVVRALAPPGGGTG
ncbi:MAG: phosphoribosyltransferase [Thermoplasmata archaeon]